ncbi:MAG: toll/interleukin-1 receptor domain-containing protein [Verrucomicrobiales bacterium]|nr:toll/interleukin-1 receptor domain-containing protein [Verrucomicrobiales bacterium]
MDFLTPLFPKNKPKVFFSHHSSNKPAVRELIQLSKSKIEPYIDEQFLKTGMDLEGHIHDVIRHCDHIVALLDAQALESEWVRNELRYASTFEGKSDSPFLIPVLLPGLSEEDLPEDCDGIKAYKLNDLNHESIVSLADHISDIVKISNKPSVKVSLFPALSLCAAVLLFILSFLVVSQKSNREELIFESWKYSPVEAEAKCTIANSELLKLDTKYYLVALRNTTLSSQDEAEHVIFSGVFKRPESSDGEREINMDCSSICEDWSIGDTLRWTIVQISEPPSIVQGITTTSDLLGVNQNFAGRCFQQISVWSVDDKSLAWLAKQAENARMKLQTSASLHGVK